MKMYNAGMHKMDDALWLFIYFLSQMKWNFIA